MHQLLRQKLLLWFAFVIAAMGAATWFGYQSLAAQIRREAEAQMDAKMEHVVDVLSATNEVYGSLVRASMATLRRELDLLGVPALDSPVLPDELPVLRFGETVVTGDFAVVDQIKALMGGTATLFALNGDRFLRVTTNVLRPDGARAVGTELDPTGRAYQAIRNGDSFYGVVDILGKPYITGYEPIRNEAGAVIGIYYVGYALDSLEIVREALDVHGILDRGFFALLDPQDDVIYQTENTPFAPDIADLSRRAATGGALPADWHIVNRVFDTWDYEIVAALYLPDINRLALGMMARAYGIAAVVLIALLGASFWMSTRLSNALVEAERARNQAVEAQIAAEAANRTKSTFLANMSHELRTPLNAIIGYSEMLVEEAEDLGEETMVPDLKKIHGAGKHLLSLINDILDLSKIEAGKMTLFPEDIDLRAMMADVTATIQPLVEKNQNRFVVDVPDDIGSMRADMTKVRQTLFNLLSNASKFTENGTITLEVRRETTEDGEFVRMRVIDTGIGMSPEQLSKLFRAFTQADPSTTRKYGGTGLGLVISQKFCQMMGGSISVKSTPGLGTTFTVELPAVMPTIATEDAGAAVPSLTQSRRVLVIDDDPDAVDLMRRKLAKVGFEVLSADSGILGLEMAHTHKPDAITLDVMMPGMDGWSVLTALKGDPETAHIPVIMVTMLQDRQMGFALGADDFLTKPVDSQKLRAVLVRHLQGEGAQVLVVEDDPTNREMLVRILEKEGYKADQAENGSRALERIAVHRPGVILLDLMMPVMDGFEFLRILRENPEVRDIPVIIVTARDLSEADRERLHGSVQDIIQKGAMDRDHLVNEVASMLAQSTDRPHA